MTSMLEIEYDDSALLESLVEDIREFADGMEATDGEWGYSLRKVKDTLAEEEVKRPFVDCQLETVSPQVCPQ